MGRRLGSGVAVVVTGEDGMIPRARSEVLAKAFAASQVSVEVVPGVGHNTLDLSPEYLRAVRGFLALASEGPHATRAMVGRWSPAEEASK